MATVTISGCPAGTCGAVLAYGLATKPAGCILPYRLHLTDVSGSTITINTGTDTYALAVVAVYDTDGRDGYWVGAPLTLERVDDTLLGMSPPMAVTGNVSLAYDDIVLDSMARFYGAQAPLTGLLTKPPFSDSGLGYSRSLMVFTRGVPSSAKANISADNNGPNFSYTYDMAYTDEDYTQSVWAAAFDGEDQMLPITPNDLILNDSGGYFTMGPSADVSSPITYTGRLTLSTTLGEGTSNSSWTEYVLGPSLDCGWSLDEDNGFYTLVGVWWCPHEMTIDSYIWFHGGMSIGGGYYSPQTDFYVDLDAPLDVIPGPWVFRIPLKLSTRTGADPQTWAEIRTSTDPSRTATLDIAAIVPPLVATADASHIDLAWPATTGPYLIERRVV